MKRFAAMLLAMLLTFCTLLPAMAEETEDLWLNTLPEGALVIDPETGLYTFDFGDPHQGFIMVEVYQPTQEETDSVIGLWSVRDESGRQTGVAVFCMSGLAAVGLDGEEPVCGTWSMQKQGRLSVMDVWNNELLGYDGVPGDALVGDGAAKGQTLVREIEKLPELLPEMCGEWDGEGPNQARMTINADGTVSTKLPGRWFRAKGYWFGLGTKTAVFVYEDADCDVMVLDGSDRLTDPMEDDLKAMNAIMAADAVFMSNPTLEIYGLIRK